LQAREADRHDPCHGAASSQASISSRAARFARLKRHVRVDDEDFADMLRELRSYDPEAWSALRQRPGARRWRPISCVAGA
jgi:RNA polymerase sigma-54 factor